ncbi:MAG: translation initiation factor IF-3 [Deltaproteobacteria bacterium]|nr:translation initiation factor IF-3 [Deltaproteobacteria bacterium]
MRPPIATVTRTGKAEPRTRVNNQIKSREVRVIAGENDQLGILTIEEALRKAAEEGLDLVEVAPQAVPPVCRIMDFGQYKYQLSKKQHEAKKNQKVIHLKEIKLRPKTEEHDFNFKLKHALEFLENGDKVKVTVMFRGRELSHKELGQRLLEKFLERSAEAAMVELAPKMEGRTMTMVLVPKKK